MKCLKVRGVDDIWVDDLTAAKIEVTLAQPDENKYITFEGRVINTADIKGIFTEADMGKRPEPLYLKSGQEYSNEPIEKMSDSERQRKIKIMIDAYIEARNELRSQRGQPALSRAELERDIPVSIFSRYV